MEKSWSLRLLKSIRMDKKLGLFRSLLGSSVDGMVGWNEDERSGRETKWEAVVNCIGQAW